ncbi:hypothetical protein KY285_021041 [Solanum tuberosum]|nr:hypothetical protein KY284_021117 [Solanum tuberosum]KAH0693944.1 hypothetical protein KY285_021041 [Solanum tuberosum]
MGRTYIFMTASFRQICFAQFGKESKKFKHLDTEDNCLGTKIFASSDFPRTNKPDRLLQFILEIDSSWPSSFAGSNAKMPTKDWKGVQARKLRDS